jgi:hypothetical protein
MFAYIFNKVKAELQIITINDTDTLEQIVEKLESQNAECFAKYIYLMGERFKLLYGSKLNAAFDSDYFRSQFVQAMPSSASKADQMTHISQLFNRYLKAAAFIIGSQFWYCKMTINEDYVFGVLLMQGFPIDYLDNIKREIRPKKEKAKSDKTKTPTDSPQQTTPQQNTPQENKPQTPAGDNNLNIESKPLNNTNDIVNVLNGLDI